MGADVMMENLLRFGPTLCLLVVAAYVDFRTGIIPNRLVGFGLALVLPIQIASVAYLSHDMLGVLPRLLGSCALGFIVCSVAPLTLFLGRAMGGGDVKLLALVGALLGPSVGIEVELYAFLLIALYALAKLAYQGRLFAMLGNTLGLAKNAFVPKHRRKAIPDELLTSLRFAPAVLAALSLITSMQLLAR